MSDIAYDVFFSYRHRPLDNSITQRAFNTLESYRLPSVIRKQGFSEIRRAFRDTEELAVSRILTETIDSALRSTNCLVVVCSTDTPSSEWIDREVCVFIELGRADRIFPLLISGDPEQSFPPSLKLIPDIMDRVMDIRADGNVIKTMMAKVETELLKVIAAVSGCGEEELRREHNLRKSRRFLTRAAATAAVFLGITGVSLGLMRQAQAFRDTASVREQASMSILHELTYTLPGRLVNVPGAYTNIAGILLKNTDDINAIVRLSRNGEAAEMEAAANYEKLATAQGVLGSYDDALQSEQKAEAIYRTLMDAGVRGSVEALASSRNNSGRLLNAAGKFAEAGESFDDAIAIYAGAENPDLTELAKFTVNAGSNAADQGNLQEAAALFEKALTLLGGAESSWQIVEATANANYNYGLILYRVGQYAQAEQKLEKATELYSSLLDHAQSLQDSRSYVQSVSALALCLADEGRFQEADSYYARGIATALAQAQDRDNIESQQNLAFLYNNRGLCMNMQEDYQTADRYYRQAADLYRTISMRTGSPSDQAVYANAMLNVGENAFKAGSYPESKKAFEEGLSAYREVCTGLGSAATAQYDAWLSYYELVHNRDPQAALSAALEGYELQPDHVLVNINLAYACLYSGWYDECDALFRQIFSLGEGQIRNIRLDLEAQQRAGMESGHLEVVWRMLEAAAGEPGNHVMTF